MQCSGLLPGTIVRQEKSSKFFVDMLVSSQEIKDTAGDDASEAGTVVEGSRFVVSRTAFKDNTSFYEVNGKRCQFKEVAVLLRQKGIDLDHNRFLILQGEVEQIAQMKAKGQNPNDTGMLEYLEDIIGSSRSDVSFIFP